MIYVASRKMNAAGLRLLRAMGRPIISSWIDEKEHRLQHDVWRAACDEISECSAFIFHDGGDGALIELGIAIGMAVPLVIVVGTGTPLALLPCVTAKDTLDEALDIAEAAVPGHTQNSSGNVGSCIR